MKVVSIVRGIKFAALVMGALAIAACAKQQPDQTAMAGAATPGSQQDFVVNVGDRVFFDTDSSELSEQARATLDKQAQWLNNYNRYAFTIEGHADERGTREYNIALGARRAQTVREYLISRGVQALHCRPKATNNRRNEGPSGSGGIEGGHERERKLCCDDDRGSNFNFKWWWCDEHRG